MNFYRIYNPWYFDPQFAFLSVKDLMPKIGEIDFVDR